ncbi:hypothetical protein C1646_682004, partial [Rhizophagus diaphanus]
TLCFALQLCKHYLFSYFVYMLCFTPQYWHSYLLYGLVTSCPTTLRTLYTFIICLYVLRFTLYRGTVTLCLW